MNSQFQSYLDNDNYIILYFNKDCYYSYGFVNEYRNDIDFIINENNKNIIYTKEESLNVIKDYGIEIHFNKAIRSLEKFFDSKKDENMINLIFVDFNFFNTISISNVFSLFHGCCSLKSVDLSNFDTSKVTDMSWMFYNCSSLESVDLSNFDTSKVTDMRWMFFNCSSLKSINLSSFDTSKVIYMESMFSGCSSLQSIDLSNFDTSKVIYMGYMFSGCYSLEYIDLSNFNTSKITDMEYMFSRCSSLKSIDLSNFDTSKVADMEYMFSGCCSLKSIDLSNFDTSKVTDMFSMFYDCYSLESIDLSNFDTSKVIYMRGMFSGCSSLKSINLSNFDTSKVTDMGYMFFGCYSLEYIDLSKFDMINCNSYENMFSDISNIRYINLYYLKNDKIISKTFDNIIEPIFVCQKDIIIDYPKAYNCCDSNLRAYNCIFKSTYFIPIIGFAIIFTVIFCCIIDCLCKKKAYPKKKTFVSNGIKPNIIEHDPQNDKDNPIKIIFQNPGIGDTSILIDSKETIDELIKFYFKACGRLDLYGDNTIFFLVNGKSIVQPYPKDFVETLKNKFVNSETIRICVNDSDDKMK